MLRVFCVAIGLMMATLSAHAGPVPAVSGPTAKAAVVFVDSNDDNDILQSESKRPRQPYVRPQRYVCVVDQSDMIGGTGQAQCPARPGRVGGSCRCANVTGSGTLYTY
ncbi:MULTISPECIES: hypothetical protein [Rhizobium]|uniref:Uncharacterized protein n=1 Tax=Rhizobium wuzhouense TaxID=1986026 RepID=A0ABX5NVM7_9HYPH|nr:MULTISPECIES: hypothetical protein [Rhizobium]PYB77235.1 hypothetical protein DMY87_02370 [Rhizobium wuzhouense]RKE85873.1 hypothetical protein DFO46_2676 [Rhizobium sp. AG855]